MSQLENIVAAVETIFNIQSSPELRRQAHEFLESVKTSPGNATQLKDTGFALIKLYDSTKHPAIRECGMNFVEHSVRYYWSDFDPSQRAEIKRECMETLGTDNEFMKSARNRDGIAKIVAEIAKREWPQGWSTFLAECKTLYETGALQKQCICALLTRLMDDVYALDIIEHPLRRKELHSALTTDAGDILGLVMPCLTDIASKLVTGAADNNQAIDVCSSILQLLSALLNWAPLTSVEMHLTTLLPVLTYLLNLPEKYFVLRFNSADCLLQLASRKLQKKDEMLPALRLFEKEEMTGILTAAKCAANGAGDETNYYFLKRICSLLSALGTMLCSLWIVNGAVTSAPANLDLYMNALMAFLLHPSLALRHQAGTVLLSFSKHDKLGNCKPFVDILPTVLDSSVQIIAKIGLPTRNEQPYSSFSVLDFDEDDDEFILTLSQFREIISGLIRSAMHHNFEMVFAKMRHLIDELLSRLENSKEISAISDLEFEALNRVLHYFFFNLAKMEAFSSPEVLSYGQKLLPMLLGHLKTQQDNAILEHVLTLIGSLGIFIRAQQDLLPAVLQGCFNLMLKNSPPSDQSAYSIYKRMKHRSANQFVRFSIDFADLLLPSLDSLLQELHPFYVNMTRRQKCAVAEGICAISNQLANFDRQQTLLASLLKESIDYFTSKTITDAIASPESFIQYLGLCDEAPPSWTDYGGSVERCLELRDMCYFVCALIGRSTIPTSREAIEAGMFLSKDASSTEYARHPAFEICQPIFISIFSLSRCLNGVYSASCVIKIHPSYGGSQAIDLPELEKSSMQAFGSGKLNASNDGYKLFPKKTVTDHVKALLSDLTEQTQLLIGYFLTKFSFQFYTLPLAQPYLLRGCLDYIDDTLDTRFRFCLRRVFTPLVNTATPETFDVIVPVLRVLLNSLYQRLQARWKFIQERQLAAVGNDTDLTVQEVQLEDMVVLLTREAMSFLKHALVSQDSVTTASNLQTDSCDEGMGNETEMFGENGVLEKKPSQSGFAESPSKLANVLCDVKVIYSRGTDAVIHSVKSYIFDLFSVQLSRYLNDCIPAMTLTVFHALTWGDTASVMKAIPLCILIVSQLATSNSLDENTVIHLYSCVLNGIRIHGQFDNIVSALLGVGCQLYEEWYCKYEKIVGLMLTIPGCTEAALLAFNKRLGSQDASHIPSERQKREVFRKLVKSIIGTSLGEQFKFAEDFRRLPPLLKPKKRMKSAQDDVVLLSDLFGSENGR